MNSLALKDSMDLRKSPSSTEFLSRTLVASSLAAFVFFILIIALWIRGYMRWDMLVRYQGNYQIVGAQSFGGRFDQL